MNTDIYKTPKADLVEALPGGDAVMFYPVSQQKFLVLFFLTLGMYTLYWFYKNWDMYKQSARKPMLPVMRAIFSIFFAHALFEAVQRRLREQQYTHDWSPAALATAYVILVVTSAVADALARNGVGFPVMELFSFATLPMQGWVMYRAQIAINLACADADGSSNSNYTAANIVWILLGLLLWAMVITGVYMGMFNSEAQF